MTVWRGLRKQGIAARHITIGGDSAGGGLTLSLLNHLRDAKEDLPGCASLVSPWTDLTMSGSTMVSKDGDDPLIHKAYLEELAAAYVPVGMDRKIHASPLFMPIWAACPMLIQVGSAETLLDDAVRLAAVAGAAEVPVTLEIWPRMIHAWPLWNAGVEAGRRALRSAGAFIRSNL